MSANRSVQAAQRRRAGPPEPSAPGRGPQPSINSSQMFASNANQRMGPGSGQVSGRLAGQQAALSQKQMMEQQRANSNSSEAISSINKMTIAQAITLITLRLGKVETLLLSNDSFTDDDDHIMVDKNVIQSLLTRIDALEKRPETGSPGGLSQDASMSLSLVKQQFDTIKPVVVQSKNALAALKQQFEQTKTELAETKELLAALQNLTMDNSQKIMALNSVFLEGQGTDMFLNDDQLVDEMDGDNNDLEDELIDSSEVIGMDLKEMIESELNGEQ
jgi:hypothetical protein